MSLHAFADESRRNRHYLVAAAFVDARDLHRLRKVLRGMLLPGQYELHFKKETPARRRAIISRLATERVAVRVYLATCGQGEERARRTCVSQLVDDVLEADAHRLVLDSREVRNEIDRVTILAALRKSARATDLVYEHRNSTQEELLWIADAVAWCYGAGGDWHRRLDPILPKVIDLGDAP